MTGDLVYRGFSISVAVLPVNDLVPAWTGTAARTLRTGRTVTIHTICDSRWEAYRDIRSKIDLFWMN